MTSEMVRVVPVVSSLTGGEIGEYRIFQGDECLGDVSNKRLADLIERLTTAIERSEQRYLSAVKGRQDFRRSYRSILPVLKAAEALSEKWRTAGQKVDSGDFFEAINNIDIAVTERRAALEATK
jgi:hypothetical protein